jgi:hypothetical protein
VKGAVVGPDGKPLAGASAATLSDAAGLFRMSARASVAIDRDTGTFTATDMDPRQPQGLIFSHEGRKLAAHAEVRGDARDPVTVRLQPWGTLKGRLLGAGGEPLSGVTADVAVRDKAGGGHTLRRGVLGRPVATDKEGRFEMEGFVPGLTFDLVFTAARPGSVPRLPLPGQAAGRVIHIVNGLSWKPGEAKDLGDLKTQPPGGR